MELLFNIRVIRLIIIFFNLNLDSYRGAEKIHTEGAENYSLK